VRHSSDVETISANPDSRPSPTDELTESDLQGFRFFKRFKGLLDLLRPCAAHRNRLLHYDEYAMAVLFYFFNPAIGSLRGLQKASGFEKVQKALGIRRMSLGSMSESVRVFDPELLAQVFAGLAQRAPERSCDPRLKDLRQVLTVVDGTILPALPRMTWAVWLGDRERGAKAHVDFEVLKGVPSQVEITAGTGAENERLKERLQAGRLYVLDRGFRDFNLFQKIVQAGSSFVVRLGTNAVYETLEEKPLAAEAVAAGVTSDRIARLGWKKIRDKFDRPVRLIVIHVPERPPRGLGYPVMKVSSKKTFREPLGQAYDMLIATDRLDLPGDVIALIYLHRWKIELFFRLLKSVLGCRHLLSDSIEGVSIQVYAALIAVLLLTEYTGLPARRRTFELVTLYLQGWVSDAEFARELSSLQKQAALEKA
jgi:hypothetical protein